MRECASKTGTGRIVMIITIHQLNSPLGCFFLPFLGSSLSHIGWIVQDILHGVTEEECPSSEVSQPSIE
ncbi:MAG: hypothetical protein ACLU62_04675 [Hydrogeniiclostridium sp.]